MTSFDYDEYQKGFKEGVRRSIDVTYCMIKEKSFGGIETESLYVLRDIVSRLLDLEFDAQIPRRTDRASGITIDPSKIKIDPSRMKITKKLTRSELR